MITKGTEDYKKAQNLANEIQRTAAYERWNNNSSFNLYFEPLGWFLEKVEKLDVFASQVAHTVGESMNPYGFCIARMSSKQAWILACAAVENGIEFTILSPLEERLDKIELD